MQLLSFILAILWFSELRSQSDTNYVVASDTSASSKLFIHPYPGTSDVCRNDTIWLYDWQYDSLKSYYRPKYNGMSIWGTGPSADTLIHFGKEDWFTSDFHGWVRDWIIFYDDCSYYFIYYDSGELHMTFEDRGEGHYGEFKEYHKNGKLKCIGSYCPEKLATRYGIWTWYDDQGKIVMTKNYRGGKYCTTQRQPLNGRSYNMFRKCDYF